MYGKKIINGVLNVTCELCFLCLNYSSKKKFEVQPFSCPRNIHDGSGFFSLQLYKNRTPLCMFPNASGWLLPKDNLHFSSTLVTAFLFPILFSPDVNTTGYQLVLVGLSHKHGWKVCNMNLPPNSYCSALNLIKRKRR